MVVCYGAPLSYVIKNRDKAILEFNRVLSKKGRLFISVNNKWGILKMLLGNKYPDFFNKPEYWYIDKVIKTGDFPKYEKVNQPARHFFEASELNNLILENGFEEILLGGSPCFSCGNFQSIEELGKDKKALNTEFHQCLYCLNFKEMVMLNRPLPKQNRYIRNRMVGSLIP